ncbi:MAG TPA: cyclic nucleotide-binding domain-containing protein [Lapillicoccus sp.]|nr:cyclic nucleotide-binding domain-containing protein [Lapillicoccus sp.]
MRVSATTTSLSWIPSDSVWGPLKLGFDLGLSHWDQPLPDRLSGVDEVQALHDAGRFRFANVLQGWAEVEDGRIVGHGFGDRSGLLMGETTVRLARGGVTFAAVGMPVLRSAQTAGDGSGGGSVVFRQTVGGRTAIPLPRPVPHPPFVRWQAPLVWTTLSLTINADGSSEASMVGASAFPRHWVYGTDGVIAWKSALTDESTWMRHSFGERTPWSDRDREAFVTEVETQVERQLSTEIMRGGARPEVRRLPEGALLTRQGDPGDELYLVLDGVAVVEVDDRAVAEVGPGAVLGERAILEDGLRTSTVRASTPLRVAVARRDAIDLEKLRELADTHRREDQPMGDAPTAPLAD